MNEYSTYAHNENKVLVHVDSVKKGKACRCTCPHCNKPLVAKNGGEIRMHHFAHLKGITCENAYETTLHLLAKDILMEEKLIMLPISENDNYPSGLIRFDEVEQEKALEGFDIRPDVIGTMSNGEKILIEFYVSHKVSGKKRDVIIQNNLKCIEIDLNYVEMDKSAIRNYLLNENRYRNWITKYEKRINGEGLGIFYQRNPLHKETIEFLKEKFEKETIKIFLSDWQTGGKPYDLKILGYDVCELLSSSFRGIKPDMLLYRSKKEDKGFIAICIRGRRRSSDFKPPINLRMIDIIIRQADEFKRFKMQDVISDRDYAMVFYGFNIMNSPQNRSNIRNYPENEDRLIYGENTSQDYGLSDEDIINDTRIGIVAPF